MRPETAYREIRKSLKPFYQYGYSDVSNINKSLLPAIDKLLEKCDENERWSALNDARFPTVRDSTKNDIIGVLHYISDRFNAPYRLVFLRLVAYGVYDEILQKGDII